MLAVIGLTLLAAALRLWRLDALPSGLHVDEAFNILDARRVLGGALPVFLPANAGRDVLYTYLQAPLLAALGESAPLAQIIGAARLASAMIGSLTVPATWWVARRLLEASDLSPARVRTIALLSAALLALSYWHLHFSRFGIRAILFPLVVVGVVGVWARVADRGRNEVLLLALLLGLAFYAHPAGRGLIALPLVDAVYRWLRWRDVRPIKVLAAATAGALLVAAPLLIYWWQHPWLFTSHAGEVSVLGQGTAAVVRNAFKVAGMFNLAGDPVRWRNLPGRPVFDVLTGLAFLLGLAIAARAAVRGACWAALALIWLGVLLVPSILTDGAPNFSRAIGVLPVACLLAALGMERVAHEIGRRTASRSTSSPLPPAVLGEGTGGWGLADQKAGGPADPHARGAAPPTIPLVLPTALLLAWLIVIGARSGYDYFSAWANDSETALAFDADKEALGTYYRNRTDQGAFVYLSPTMAEHPTVQVAAGRPPSSFDPREGWVLPLDARTPAEFAVLFNEFDMAAALSGGIFREIDPIALPDRMRVFENAVRIAGEGKSGGPWQFGPHFSLADIDIPAEVRAGAAVPLRLEWDVIQPSEIPLHTAVQLQGLDGAGLGHGDGPPLGGSYPTDRWRPGERIVTTHTLHVDADAPPGPAELRIGWYAPPEGDRPFQPLVLDDRGTTVVVVGRTEVVP